MVKCKFTENIQTKFENQQFSNNIDLRQKAMNKLWEIDFTSIKSCQLSVEFFLKIKVHTLIYPNP